MKRRSALPALLTAVIIIGSFPFSLAAGEGLSVREWESFGGEIRRAARDAGQFSLSPALTGYALRYKDFALYTDTPFLEENTAVSAVLLDVPPEEDENTVPAPRNCGPGASVQEVLSTYPLSNTPLSGTREEAALFVEGNVPGTAAVGLMERAGQNVLSVTYSLYQTAEDGVKRYRIIYTFLSGYTANVRVELSPALIPLDQARTEVENAADLLKISEYSAFQPAGEAGPFQRDDLIFSGLDFLTLTPGDAEKVLGNPLEDKWLTDGDRMLRVMTWDGLSITFVCGMDREAEYAASLYLDRDLLEGPRGLMPGAPSEVLFTRFRYTPDDVSSAAFEIYRVDENTFATLELPAQGIACARYYCRAEGRNVMLRVYAENELIRDLTLLVTED